MKIWTCKIGECDDADLPSGADGPMREAVQKAYREIIGRDCVFNFSGWGGELDECERAVVENRLPRTDPVPPDPRDAVVEAALRPFADYANETGTARASVPDAACRKAAAHFSREGG